MIEKLTELLKKNGKEVLVALCGENCPFYIICRECPFFSIETLQELISELEAAQEGAGACECTNEEDGDWMYRQDIQVEK